MKKTIMSLALFAMTTTSIQFTPQQANANTLVGSVIALAAAREACRKADDGRDFAYQWRLIAAQGMEDREHNCKGSKFYRYSEIVSTRCTAIRGRDGRRYDQCLRVPGPKKIANRCSLVNKSISKTNRKIRSTGGRAYVENCKQSYKKCWKKIGFATTGKQVKGFCQKYSFRLGF
jgi:hypothetical protein